MDHYLHVRWWMMLKKNVELQTVKMCKLCMCRLYQPFNECLEWSASVKKGLKNGYIIYNFVANFFFVLAKIQISILKFSI